MVLLKNLYRFSKCLNTSPKGPIPSKRSITPLQRALTTDGGDRTEINCRNFDYAKFSDKFSQESLYISNTFSRESSRFQAGFCVSKLSPRHSKECPGKLDNSGDPKICSQISSVSGAFPKRLLPRARFLLKKISAPSPKALFLCT